MACAAPGRNGQIVIYLEQLQQPDADYSLRIDHIRLQELHRHIEIAPVENIIASDDLRTQQFLLADSMIEPGNYDTLAISGTLGIAPSSANVPRRRQVAYDAALPVTLTLARRFRDPVLSNQHRDSAGHYPAV
jgi:hypothetical protein